MLTISRVTSHFPINYEKLGSWGAVDPPPFCDFFKYTTYSILNFWCRKNDNSKNQHSVTPFSKFLATPGEGYGNFLDLQQCIVIMHSEKTLYCVAFIFYSHVI